MGDIRFSYNDDFNKTFLRPPNLSPIGICGAKVWYLRCESMVFVVQKYGVCSAKVWCLRCESMVFRGCTCVYCNLFAALLQTVSSIVAIR